MSGIELVAATTAATLLVLAVCLLTARPERARVRSGLVFAFDDMERSGRRARRRRLAVAAVLWAQAAAIAAAGIRGWF